MFEVFGRWYQRKFSDPDAAMLLFLIIASALVLLVWGEILAPVMVAVALAYLLDWPVLKLQGWGLQRGAASAVVLLIFVSIVALASIGLIPVIWQQGVNFVGELPQIWQKVHAWIMSLPNSYPQYINGAQIEQMLADVDQGVVLLGEELLEASVSSLFGAVALLIYLILVPIMVLFMLKDKQQLLANISQLLPQQRRLIKQVGQEMNIQILNYLRGKVIEITIVGAVAAVTFALMDLRYSLLLGVLVGVSVLIPYIGAAIVTLPIAAVAMFQWGIDANFWWLLTAYGIIQALDGNVLVPLLFSEAVSLHPVYIIVAVLFFGGLFGFWGVFFAIPMASLVRALLKAWSTPAEPVTNEG